MGYEVLLVVTPSVVLPPRKKKRPEVFPQDAFTHQRITLFFFNPKSKIENHQFFPTLRSPSHTPPRSTD